MKALKAGKESGAAPSKGGAPPPEMKGGCRPCDQPHFFLGDTPTTKVDHGLLVADYPIKDWDTGKPKPLVAKPGEQYVVTGLFAIDSIGGFAASDGLIVHKKFVDSSGKVLAEGNAVLPPDAQDIKLEGKEAEKVGGARIDAEKWRQEEVSAPNRETKKGTLRGSLFFALGARPCPAPPS